MKHSLPYFAICLALLALNAEAGEIYKYKDANGRWHFTDKKPQDQATEEVRYQKNTSVFIEPTITIELDKGSLAIIATNP